MKDIFPNLHISTLTMAGIVKQFKFTEKSGC